MEAGSEPVKTKTMPLSQTWITICIATVAGLFTALTYAHNTFVTLREADSILSQLNRIEQKLDKVLTK